jgi:hypothetical protein
VEFDPQTVDAAEHALAALVLVLDRCIVDLTAARERAARLLARRRTGRSWSELTTEEPPPQVVAQLSAVLAALASAGGAWRREQARALQAEHVSINRIAALFGVTRQRVSALLREPPAPDPRPPSDTYAATWA